MSSGELAHAVNAIGARQGQNFRYDRTSVAHWLTGSCPQGPVPELVSQILSTRLNRLVTPAQTGLLPQRATTAPPPRSADLVLLDLGTTESDPARHAALLRAPWVSWRTLSTAPHDAVPAGRLPSGPRTLHDNDLALLDWYRGQFTQLFERYGSGGVFSALRAFITADAVSFLASRAPARSRRAAQRATAQLVHLLATASVDADRLGLAQRYHRVALSLADEAEDGDLRAIILRSMSNQARIVGYTADALHLAEASRAGDGHLTPATRAFLLTGQAAALATDDTREQPALSALDTAHRLLDENAADSDPYTGYSRAAYEHQRGEVLSLLGDQHQAAEAFAASLEHRPPAHRRSRGITACALASTQLRVGHIEAACASWTSALETLHVVYSPRLQHLLTRLREEAQPYRHHAPVRTLRHHTRAALSPRQSE
ncbi:hypothetical protein G3I40_04075 [Streptomyces sp. SID14478]|uniref:hypothetical protein n=1 Tax=Streptomyces sp. SID14478 TaxID=2706073 RepID=UPI0013D91716|nr:hypothetical protein [Streptomyces sp. SID14478]NEB74412.1 hypothetical protein [Streptomyces sp. SID14478]